MNLIIKNFIQKLIKSGKKSKAYSIYKKLLILYKYKQFNNSLILNKIFLKLYIPINFKTKKVGIINYQIPILIHFYKSLLNSINWFIKSAKSKKQNKMSLDKALYLESLDILKNQGLTITSKQNFVKKILINRIFIYLLSIKKIKNSRK